MKREAFNYRVGPAAVLAMVILGCGQEAGPADNPTSIAVSITTSGVSFDPDGYLLALGNAMPIHVSTSGKYKFAVEPGAHTLRLSNVAGNCAPAANPVLVLAEEGRTVQASLHVDCHLIGGKLEIIVHTAGPAPDSDGYLVSVPGMLGPVLRHVAVNDSADLGSFPPGSYYVSISGISPNCATAPLVRVALVVPDGTTRVTFNVTCQDPAAVGGLRLLVSTSGPPDVDGYTVSIDGGTPVPLGLTDSLFLTLIQGPHTVQLSGTTMTCIPTGGTQRIVSVVAGVTTNVSMTVVCWPVGKGRIRFHGTTTGSQIPGLFIAIVSLGGRLVDIVDLAPNGTVLSRYQTAGAYSVSIATGPCNGGTRAVVRITARTYTEFRFTAVCP